ncbi:MAG TPA: YqgE/AlgH family protein [Aquella sp.]|nr:YqgE/AlgH family protein [Aquella sp.]
MTSLTDYFLVAMPTVTDYGFSGSVVYVTNHDVANGAVGVIVNKPLNRTLKNAFKDLDFSQYNPGWVDAPLYWGGPLAAENGFVLHRTGEPDKRIFELTNNRNVLTDIAASDQKDRLFVSVGYVAWSDFQMENEIRRNDWLVVKADLGLIFDVDASVRYHEALSLLGIRNPAQVYCSGEVFA